MRLVLTILLTIGLFSAFAQKAPKATEADVAYGKHERNKMDFWKADSSKPTPVLVFFHGGGFKKGDKSSISRAFNISEYLEKGVSCITINYPFLKHTNNNYMEIMKHCQNAIDFIKKNSKSWNIDTKRIAASGSSAGALISQYLGFKGKDIQVIGSFAQPMGTDYFVLPHIKKSSPPIMIYQRNPISDKVHHPKFAKMVKDTCDNKKSECIIYGTGDNGIPEVPDGKNPKEVMMDFFFDKWGMK